MSWTKTESTICCGHELLGVLVWVHTVRTKYSRPQLGSLAKASGCLRLAQQHASQAVGLLNQRADQVNLVGPLICCCALGRTASTLIFPYGNGTGFAPHFAVGSLRYAQPFRFLHTSQAVGLFSSTTKRKTPHKVGDFFWLCSR